MYQMASSYIHQGLNTQQVEESRRRYGSNVLTAPPQTSLWVQYMEKYQDPIIRILLFAWVLSMIISAIHCWGPDKAGWQVFIEPAGIFAAIVLATTVGFLFEVKAARAFAVLNRVNDEARVTVVRNGNITETDRADIVVGDIVLLDTGDEIPADGILLEAVSLQVNESTLTGEPMTHKSVREEDFDPEATYPSNHILRGTTVLDGHCVFRVKAVGDTTEYGKVNHGAQMENNLETPLQLQLKRLADFISKAGYTVAILTFIALMVKAFLEAETTGMFSLMEQTLHNFMIAVTLVVVSVPEGLPMSVTISLALSMNRMLRTNNLVRKMHACETMGAATVICTDKTGTLTQNRMRVAGTYFCGTEDNIPETDNVRSALIREGIAVNSTANLIKEGNTVNTLGNPTEAALLLWLEETGYDYGDMRANARILSQLTFSTERKYMATVVYSPLLDRKILYVKGAPEIVLEHCSNVATVQGQKSKPEVKTDIETRLLAYQSKAMRTLGLAYKLMDEEDSDNPYIEGRLCMHDLTFLGIAAISDPVRKDVPAAVEQCRRAGIEIKIVTGDTSATALEIARQIGVWTDEKGEKCIITGQDFALLSDEEAAKQVQELRIMCRARPTDKQRLVRLLQAGSAVVAVTGDGTNDAPALKAAQVGLSMGDGTSVAKEASDITILDNSFTSIAKAVMWGRSLYGNIQRFLLFQLTVNVVACSIVLICSMLGMGSPLTITQMLWVNLIMDTFAAGALSSLPPNPDVMQEMPRKSGEKGDFIITRSMAWHILGTGLLFTIILMGALLYMHHKNDISALDLSRFFTFFVMLQIWNMFNARAFNTHGSGFAGLWQSKGFLFVILQIVVGQILITTFGGSMFQTAPLPLSEWLLIIVLSAPVLLIGEAQHLLHKIKKTQD